MDCGLYQYEDAAHLAAVKRTHSLAKFGYNGFRRPER